MRAIYQQDSNGNLRRDANGRVIRVTTDALATAKLQYTELGAEAERSYEGYYPSINAYRLRDNRSVHTGTAPTRRTTRRHFASRILARS